MKLEALIKEIQPATVTGTTNGEVLGVVCDSRHVRPGYVFVAIAGWNQDGWSFVNEAIERGAIAVVSEHEEKLRNQKPEVCFIRVEDSRQSMGEMACIFNNRPSNQLQLIGITGTNGKTTTSYMIRDILRADGRNPGLISTVAYEIGARVIPAERTTPESPLLQSILAQMVHAGCDSAVMEVSSHALVQKRTTGIDYDVGIFTNLTRDHLDYHGTMEKYFEAKALLFRELGKCEKNAVAVINVDDPWGRQLSQMNDMHADVLTYSLLDPQAMIRAEDVELTASGSAFRVLTPWGDAKIQTKLLGRFNISNALAAIASCGALGINLDVIASVLSKIVCVPGRLEEIETRKGFQVFVDYAHTDDALEHVLTTLREITNKRLIVVFGCGGNRDKTKRPAMGSVAARLADYSILTTDNPRKEDPSEIIAQIRGGFDSADNFEIVEDRTEAIKRSLAMADRGDVVLIAGKGHENFQEFANTTIPFDDRQVVRALL